MFYATIWIKIDSVNKLAKSITAYITQSDLKSDYLFRMCSVATNLRTSLECRLIRCAITLFQFGRTRNGCKATHFVFLNTTAKSSATSGNVVVPERFVQNEEPANENEQRARKKRSSVSSSGFKRCNMKIHTNKYLIQLFRYFGLCIFFTFGAFFK